MSEPIGPRYLALPGSERTAPANATPVGPADPSARVRVSVYLRPRTAAQPSTQSEAPASGQPLSHEEFVARYGADPADIARVEQVAREHHLSVVETDAARRVVMLEGTVADLNAAFQVDLQHYDQNGQIFRGRTGHVYIPAELAGIVTGIFGLDDRPQAGARLQAFRPHAPIILAINAAQTSYTPPQVAALYNYPTAGNGQGQTIALIELGGGYQQSDLDTYFQQLGLATPTVVVVPVDGGANSPTGDPNSADGEVMLDIEVAGGLAPGARVAVYFAPNTDQGFLDAVTTAVHDTTNTPSVVSISWGGPESSWTAQAQQQMSQAFQDAGTLGITVCCAAGDSGASDGVGDGLLHVDFPASSPYALGCGGTSLTASGSTIASETVWNDGNGAATGGGISDTFDLPSWQANASVPASANPGGRVGRGVPDVSGDADPQTGYLVQVDGQSFVVGGTSAVAPLWAGLIALLNQQLPRHVGFINPVLYQQPPSASVLHDITSGANDGYSAGPGWDACTGLGSPNGAALLSALAALQGQPAGAAVKSAILGAQTANVPVVTASNVGATSEPAPVAASPARPDPVASRPTRGFFASFRSLFRRD
jgi:kumamolisin